MMIMIMVAYDMIEMIMILLVLLQIKLTATKAKVSRTKNPFYLKSWHQTFFVVVAPKTSTVHLYGGGRCVVHDVVADDVVSSSPDVGVHLVLGTSRSFG